MGYFDGLTAASFKRDSSGRELFFFWGRLGRGRVIPSEADTAYVKRYLKNYFISVFVVVVPVVVLSNNVLFSPAWLGIVGGVILALLLGLTPLYLRVRDWELSDERLTYRETLTASAKAHGPRTMLFFVIVLGLAAAAGLFITLFTTETLTGGILTVFCSAGVIVFWFMLRASRRS